MTTCTDCELHHYARGPVPGDGPVPCDVMIIGEAPGADEDRQGKPFIGAAGRLLNSILKSVGTDRREVFVTNICKCKPKANKDPKASEFKKCLPNLIAEVARVQPKSIITLGNVALQALTGKAGITKARGIGVRSAVLDMDILPTFHPASVLHGREEHKQYIERDIRKGVESAAHGVKDKIETRYTLLRSLDEIAQFVELMQRAEVFTYDIEATGVNPRCPEARVLLVGVCVAPGTAYVIPVGHPQSPLKYQRGTVTNLLQKLFSTTALKIAHNAKYDIQYFVEVMGVEVRDPIYCTLLAHYLIDATRGTHGLKTLVWDYTTMGGYEKELDKWFIDNGMVSTNSREYKKVPIEMLYTYCAADCDATMRLYEKFNAEHTPAQRKLMSGFYAKALRVVIDMERTGMCIDKEYMAQLDTALPERRDTIGERMRGMYRPEVEEMERRLSTREFEKRCARLKNPEKAKPKRFTFNWGSPDQLRELLFDVMSLPNNPKSKTPSGKKSADEDALVYILERQQCSLIEDLLDWNKLDKLHGTFVKGLCAKIAHDGHVHGEFNLSGTETGRTSSSGPNLQNIPRTSLIKNQFISPPGWTIVQADFSQIELRVAAMLSGDETMIQLFRAGGDMHIETAARVYAKAPDEITKEQRNLAKGVGFGILYQRGAKAISAATGVPLHEAKKFIKDYYNIYKGVAAWVDKQKVNVRKTGIVSTPFGRTRYLPGALSSDKEMRAAAERQAVNTPIQSIASEITVMSMILLHEEFDPNIAKIVCNVHDAVKNYVRDAYVDSICRTCKSIMENIPGLPKILTTVPVVVDVEIGRRWGELKEWKGTDG